MLGQIKIVQTKLKSANALSTKVDKTIKKIALSFPKVYLNFTFGNFFCHFLLYSLKYHVIIQLSKYLCHKVFQVT